MCFFPWFKRSASCSARAVAAFAAAVVDRCVWVVVVRARVGAAVDVTRVISEIADRPIVWPARRAGQDSVATLRDGFALLRAVAAVHTAAAVRKLERQAFGRPFGRARRKEHRRCDAYAPVLAVDGIEVQV